LVGRIGLGDQTKVMDEKTYKRTILRFMQNEITEHHVYLKLAARCKGKNRDLLSKIAEDELRHYQQFRLITDQDIGPRRFKIFAYILLSRLLGITFAMKLMETGEVMAEAAYEKLLHEMPDIARIIEEEARHEKMLLGGIEEESLGYFSSVVLAVNNALQEFTGIAVGLTFAMQDSRAVANTVLISGLAASLAMAASEYLSQKAEGKLEGHGKRAVKAAVLTGIAYLIIVLLIVMPFYLVPGHFAALAITLGLVFVVITLFAFFMAVVKEMRFPRLFAEILILACVVVSASFGIGLAARHFLGAGN